MKANTQIKKSPVTAKEIAYLNECTKYNAHTEALFHVCEMFGFETQKKQLNRFMNLRSISLEDQNKRYKIYTRIMARIKKEYGPKVFETIYKCL